MGEWTREQIENFLRHETMKNDDQCKKLAGQLAKNGLLNLMVRSNPSEYTERHE